MENVESFATLLSIAGVGVGIIFWFAKLEGKTNRANERIEEHRMHSDRQMIDLEKRLDARRHEDQQAALLSRHEVLETLQTIQSDIKKLLEGRQR